MMQALAWRLQGLSPARHRRCRARQGSELTSEASLAIKLRGRTFLPVVGHHQRVRSQCRGDGGLEPCAIAPLVLDEACCAHAAASGVRGHPRTRGQFRGWPRQMIRDSSLRAMKSMMDAPSYSLACTGDTYSACSAPADANPASPAWCSTALRVLCGGCGCDGCDCAHRIVHREAGLGRCPRRVLTACCTLKANISVDVFEELLTAPTAEQLAGRAR
jgi:hypothetical protein